MVKYKSTLYPIDLHNTPKLIWEVGQRFREQKLDDGGKYTEGKRIASNPPLICKLYYLLYLTGSRIGEPLQMPTKCKLIQTEIRGKLLDVMAVQKLNLKHFDEKVFLDEYSGMVDRFKNPIRKTDLENSKRNIITQQLPIDNDWEAKLWSYTLGKERSEMMALETDIDFSYFGGYTARNAISEYMSNNFLTDLTNGEQIFKDEGIRPHMLRHLRAYNLLVEKGFSETLVQTYMGWSRKETLQSYVYITKMINAQKQLDMLKKQISLPSTEKMPRYGTF